ncbi:hypothetical protein BTR23_16345 [Alkalihalophilus pseudofirmus]|nr:hypothetical protein BTR23_16345 [Alkalihalophilus pseudofirmus]
MLFIDFISVWNSQIRYPSFVFFPKEEDASKLQLPEEELEKIKQYNVVVVANTKQPLLDENPPIDEMASKFTKLKSLSDIDHFANEYGLLGVIGDVQPQKIHQYNDGAITSYFEPLSVWIHHVNTVRKFMYLYRALTNKKERIESGFYRACIEDINFFNFEDNAYLNNEVKKLKAVHKNGHTLMMIWDEIKNVHPNKSDAEIAYRVLINALPIYLRGGVHLGFKEMSPSKKLILSYQVTEMKYTENLLASIYLDMWNMVLKNKEVTLCENVKCGLPMQKSGKKKHCNDACKQVAYRYRKEIITHWKDGQSYERIMQLTDIDLETIKKVIQNSQTI